MKLKTILIAVAVLIVVWIVYAQISKPSYADPHTPTPYLGAAEASVQIVEYGDIQCPACRAAHPVVKQIVADYGEQIGFQFRHFPLTQIHPYAEIAAQAAECANDQGAYYDFIDFAYANQNDLSKGALKNMAATLQLDTTSFNACLDSGAKRSKVQADAAEARSRGVQATPTFFINGRRIASWDYQSFTAEINQELAQ